MGPHIWHRGAPQENLHGLTEDVPCRSRLCVHLWRATSRPLSTSRLSTSIGVHRDKTNRDPLTRVAARPPGDRKCPRGPRTLRAPVEELRSQSSGLSTPRVRRGRKVAGDSPATVEACDQRCLPWSRDLPPASGAMQARSCARRPLGATCLNESVRRYRH
jgi:hypothetical protein